MVGEGPPSTTLILKGKSVDTGLRRHDGVAPPEGQFHNPGRYNSLFESMIHTPRTFRSA
jgi:hypothetical protein